MSWFRLKWDSASKVPDADALEALAKKVEGDWEQGQKGYFSEREVVPGIERITSEPHGEDQRCLQSVRNTDQVDWSQWETHFVTEARKQAPSDLYSMATWEDNFQLVTISEQWNTPSFEDWQFTQGSPVPNDWPADPVESSSSFPSYSGSTWSSESSESSASSDDGW